MPRYYCDYCDAFLTHDSPSVRKQHNSGRKHRDNVCPLLPCQIPALADLASVSRPARGRRLRLAPTFVNHALV